jgi:hypothetical protein
LIVGRADRSGPEAFEAMLSAVEIAALCHALGVRPPVPLEDPGLPPLGGTEPQKLFDDALRRLAGRGVIAYEGGPLDRAEGVGAALALLSSPSILLTMERRDFASAEAASIAVGGGRAAEHRRMGDDRHRVALFPSEEALDRTVAFCGLQERPVHDLPGFVLTLAQLVRASELAAGGDARGATAVLAGSRAPDPSRALFLRALTSRPVAAHVTVLASRGDRRVEGTATAWLDGGEAGLWRIPALDTSPPDDPDAVDEQLLHGTLLEVRPVSREELLDEITEGFAELRAS